MASSFLSIGSPSTSSAPYREGVDALGHVGGSGGQDQHRTRQDQGGADLLAVEAAVSGVGSPSSLGRMMMSGCRKERSSLASSKDVTACTLLPVFSRTEANSAACLG